MHSNLALVIIAISATVICIKAAVVHQSVTRELEIYQRRVRLLYDTLKKECPEETLLSRQFTKREAIGHLPDDDKKASVLLENEKALLAEIMQELIECRERKTGKNITTTPSTTAKTPTTITTPTSAATKTTATTSIIPTTATTALHPECLHKTGYTKMQIDFVRYQNPSNDQATGRQCDDKSRCNLYLEICVSAVGERNCSYYHLITEGVGQGPVITFSSEIGGSANPVIVDFSERKWEGVNILVTVWAKDINQKTDDVVDEFSYDAVDSPGSPSRNVNLSSSVKKQTKSSLALALRTYCPSPLSTTTTATTTTTTTPTTTTTTLSPAQQACASAINLTESWRRDSAGSQLRPVNGTYNCDTRDMVSQGRPWFRFSGAAGNRLLDKCPPLWSCGTGIALWSSDPMPDDVGVEALISMSSYLCKPLPSISQVSVMRCSTRQYDFIYRYDDSGTECAWGFCGMN